MAQFRDGLGLLHEAAKEDLRLGGIGRHLEHLDRHMPVEADLHATVEEPESPFGDQRLDEKAPREKGAYQRKWV